MWKILQTSQFSEWFATAESVDEDARVSIDPFRQAVLLIGGNKTGDKRFYTRLLHIADTLYDHYLHDLGERK